MKTIAIANFKGVVVQIHEAHRWYRAEYDTPMGTQHETFKF